MVWNSLDLFAKHLPTLLIATLAGALVAGGRGWYASGKSRQQRGILRRISCSVNSSLSGACGAAIMTAGVVEPLAAWPYMAVFLAIHTGLVLDVFRANGASRLWAMWLEYLARIREVKPPP